MDIVTEKKSTTIKSHVQDLAVFGGACLFEIPKSTSNLLKPDVEKYLGYSRVFFDKQHYTNSGPNLDLLEHRLKKFHGTNYCVGFSSGFWALANLISVLATPGKTEIIMPSLTYRRMADIAAWVKLMPHFCEVEKSNLAMSAATVDPCINDNTAIILAAHPIVACCNIGELERLARNRNIPLIFDSVESVFESTADGRIGGFGCAEVFSLHACKLLNGFGGGYLTTNDKDLAELMSLKRGFGFKGKDNIEVGGGMNSKLNEMHAAMALASLDDIDKQVEVNLMRYKAYQHALSSIHGLKLVEFDEKYRCGYKNIVVEILEDWPFSRAQTITILNSEGVLARPYYSPPLHQKPSDLPSTHGDLSLTESLGERFLNLPCGQRVTIADINILIQFFKYILLNSDKIKRLLNEDRP